jgi:hypothetical protein
MMTTQLSTDTTIQSPTFFWETVNWALSPICYFFPKLSAYILESNLNSDSHISQIIAKKIELKTPFEVLDGKKIQVVGGKYSFLKALIIAPKIIEKTQLFELTRAICELKDNHKFQENTTYIVSALITLLCYMPGIYTGTAALIVTFATSIYFSRQATLIYDEKAAQIVGFDLARKSIASQKTSLLPFIFSPSIDQRLKYLDEAEKNFSNNQKELSLEGFFSTNEVNKE